jgi:hypothetical protein
MSQLLTSENLPLTQKKRLHKDFIENEKLYWRMREQLLKQYGGKWVAIEGGRVVASGDDLFDVTDEVGSLGCHAYIAQVGREDSLVFIIRREFTYDATYQPFALPQAEVIFFNYRGTARQLYPDVIPDTGADLSALPEEDCAAIDLFGSPYLLGLTRGVLGPSVPTLVYRGNAEINGASYRSLIQPIPGGKERILGRDVLNQLKVTFDGPQKKVLFD